MISYSAWYQNQMTRPNAAVMPSWKQIQNQRCSLVAPASSVKPMVTTTAKQTMPKNGLGNPKMPACSVFMTVPQEIHGLTSQLVT